MAFGLGEALVNISVGLGEAFVHTPQHPRETSKKSTAERDQQTGRGNDNRKHLNRHIHISILPHTSSPSQRIYSILPTCEAMQLVFVDNSLELTMGQLRQGKQP